MAETTGPSWATPAYDRNGNITSVPKPSDMTTLYTCTFDSWNRLVKVVDGAATVATYAYDGSNRRTTKTSSGTTRHYYFSNSWQVLEERLDASSNADRQFVWGLRYVDDLILRDRDTTDPPNGTLDERIYCLQDPNWNVVAITDNTGTVKERFAYQPYGQSEPLDSNFTDYTGSDYSWGYRFTGRELDIDSGLQLNRNRYFHLQLGRWVTRDPLGYVDGMSLYRAYFVPAETDPTGLCRPVGRTKDGKLIIQVSAGCARATRLPAGSCFIWDGKTGTKTPTACPPAKPIPPKPAKPIPQKPDRPIDKSKDEKSFNCGGLAFRDYKNKSYDQVTKKLEKECELSDLKKGCPKEGLRLKCIFYDINSIKYENEKQVQLLLVSGRYHIVCALDGRELRAVSKMGRGPIEGPGPIGSFPPTQTDPKTNLTKGTTMKVGFEIFVYCCPSKKKK